MTYPSFLRIPRRGEPEARIRINPETNWLAEVVDFKGYSLRIKEEPSVYINIHRLYRIYAELLRLPGPGRGVDNRNAIWGVEPLALEFLPSIIFTIVVSYSLIYSLNRVRRYQIN